MIARKVDLDFFRNISVREDCATNNDDEGSVGSIPPSLASGPSMIFLCLEVAQVL